jgi:hypothetical protein
LTDIYQQIWTADQQSNGIEPVISTETGDADAGFVKVNDALGDIQDPDLRVLTEVEIPAAKSTTYDHCRRLFNNYALAESDLETDTAIERAERHEFVEEILHTSPMQVARAYIEAQTETAISDERWHTTLIDHWFRRFEMGGDPHLSGFEHVMVGEQEGGKVQGYHFWYKYFLDDGFARHVDDGLAVVPGLSDDRITYVRSHASAEQLTFPESVTIQYEWHAPDYDRNAVRPLHKPIGGFFVGCSVEGLMALGTVRAHLGARAPKTAVIEGARYDMKLYCSGNNRHIRTFYPMFKGAADPVSGTGTSPAQPRPVPPGAQGDVRIIAALVNPVGNDPGRENVTLVHTGPHKISIDGWRLRDKNGNVEVLSGVELTPGVPHTVVLTGNGAQLSNKGSTITLLRDDGATIHQVSYSKSQARNENKTLLFL